MQMRTVQLSKLPESAHQIIITLAEHGVLIQKEITHYTNLPAKTVRYAMKKLYDCNIARTHPNFNDMRSPMCSLNPDFNNEFILNEVRRLAKV